MSFISDGVSCGFIGGLSMLWGTGVPVCVCTENGIQPKPLAVLLIADTDLMIDVTHVCIHMH